MVGIGDDLTRCEMADATVVETVTKKQLAAEFEITVRDVTHAFAQAHVGPVKPRGRQYNAAEARGVVKTWKTRRDR